MKIQTPLFRNCNIISATFILCFCIFQVSAIETQKKISLMNVLLPVCTKSKCKPVYQKVSGDGGCFEWRIERPDLVDIKLSPKKSDKNNCCSKVLISPLTTDVNAKTNLIARDKNTGEEFKCIVEFGEVHRIAIEKTFTQLMVGELYELSVQAYDERDNLFSSLMGWSFNWKISVGADKAELLKLSSNGNKKIGSRRELIEKTAHSDMISVRGHSVGKVTLGVELLEEGLKEISSIERDLFIIEPFKIIPHELYILPRTQFEFDIEIERTKKRLSTTERQFFEWSVDEDECGQVNGFGEFGSLSKECIVRVTAQDNRLEISYKQTAIVHVVLPSALNMGYKEISYEEKNKLEFLNFQYNDLTFSPKWGLVENKYYYFRNFLMYDNIHPVHFNRGKIQFSLNLGELGQYIEGRVPFCIKEKEICMLTTTKATGDTGESLEGIAYIEGGHELHSTKNVIIYERVKIEKFGMHHFTLPYIPDMHQELYLIVTGGTNNYRYTSNSQQIVSVDIFGKILGQEIGIAKIKVADSLIPGNFDEVEIHVKEIKFITYFEERQEVAKDSYFQITPVGIHNTERGAEYKIDKIFTNCTNLSFKSEINLKSKAQSIDDQSKESASNKIKRFINFNKEILKAKIRVNDISGLQAEDYLKYASFGICSSNNFTALEEGLIQISYKTDTTVRNGNIISAKNPAQVYIYLPLKILPTIKDNFTEAVINKGNLTHPDTEKTYIIKEGVGVVLSLSGGVIPWINHKEDYLEDKYIIDPQQNTRSISTQQKIEINTLESKKLYAYCYQNEHEETFQITIHNKRDKTLINPAECKIQFTIGCHNPKALGIYFLSQLNNMIIPMYAVFQQPALEYFEKVNTTDVLRVYAFDERKRMFSNITALRGVWSPHSIHDSDEKYSSYYELVNERDYEKYGYNDVPYGYEFLQNIVLFKHTSEFYLQYSLKSNLVTHNARIKIINNPILTPTNATLYVRDTELFELRIIGGSGEFEVSLSDNSLASFVYDKYEKKIRISPFNKGILQVFVKDLQLPNEEKVSSILYLSDVDKILLTGDGPSLVNKTIPLHIQVFDNFGHKYPDNILSKIQMDYDSTDLNGISLAFGEGKKTLLVTGLIPGIYAVNVKDTFSFIRSNDAKVEIFDRLEIFPPYLLLVPGSSYTLSVIGGPVDDKAILKFEMVDTKIANVTSISYPEVNALLQGETILKVSLLYNFDYNKFYNKEDDKHIINRTEILCVENIPVRVDFPNKIEIMGVGNNRNVFTGSAIRLLTAVKKDEEVFTYGIGPLEFKWNVDSPRIANIKYYAKSTKSNVLDNLEMVCTSEQIESCTSLTAIEEDSNPGNSIGVFLNTLQEGIVTISLTVKITYPVPYTKHQPNIFETTEKLKISDEIVANINSKYGTPQKQTGLYMIPFNVEHELRTNKNTIQKFRIKHKESDYNILNLSENGRVTTYNTVGQVTIEITQVETKDGIATLPTLLVVYVSDFYSIFVERSFNLIDMQIGQEMFLKVRIQHDSGIAFADKCEGIPLRLVESHPKIAKGELIESNSQIRIKANNIGSTNIILFHPKTRKIYDVFKINVNKDITFLQKIILNVGGTINFLEKDKEKKQQISKDAEWISENPEVVEINPTTGFAKGLNEGISTIILRSLDKSKVKLTTKVEVRKVKNLVLDKTTIPTSLTDIKDNPNYQSEYHIPVNLLTETDDKFTKNSKDGFSEIQQNINFKCATDNSDLFIGNFVQNEDDYECVVKIRDKKYEALSNKPKNIGLRLIAESTSPSNPKNKYTFESKETIPFSSSFNIKDNVQEINLSFNKRDKFIYIDNLNDLEYKISDQNKVAIEEENKDKGYIKVVVKTGVLDSFKNVQLTITNILSHQTKTININFTASSGSTLFFGLVSQETFTDFLTMILLIVIIIILVFYITNGKSENPGASTLSNPPMYGSRGMYGPGSATPNIRNGPKGSSHQANFDMNNYGRN